MRFLRSVFILCAVLSSATSSLAQGGPSQAPPPVTVARPVVKDIIERTDFIGRFEAINQVDIRTRVSGYLDKVHFQDGAFVKAGDLLFTIDPRPYKNALEQAQAAVTSSQVGLEFAQSDLGRAEQLRRTGNITDQLFDQRRQSDSNILTQIRLVVLVGLAAKNAILIVEFAKQAETERKTPVEAVVEACRLRLRPILMTAFAFILGVLPLVIARGPGAEMRQALGTAVFAGMFG